MDEKISLVIFTDPMMGLSYECEPIMRKIETHFANRVEFDYVMSGLVRDVYELVDPDELALGKDVAIDRYNARLADVYRAEEALGGLPINMTNFALFSTTETSSDPLNIAFKAAQIVDAARAERFLYRLRFATVAECRPTTKLTEILRVAIQCGIDSKKFLAAFNDGRAEKNFRADLEICRRLEIHSLPSYLIQFKSRGALIQNLVGYETFAQVFAELSGIRPTPPPKTLDAVRELLRRRVLVSPIELREAFGFDDVEQVRRFIAPLIDSGEIKLVGVDGGRFIEWEV